MTCPIGYHPEPIKAKSSDITIGIDPGDRKHAVCMLDAKGGIVEHQKSTLVIRQSNRRACCFQKPRFRAVLRQVSAYGGLAQSRQGAKEEEDWIEGTPLCVSAPLREILFEPASGDLRSHVHCSFERHHFKKGIAQNIEIRIDGLA